MKLKHVKTKQTALKKIVTTIQEVLTVFILAKKDRHLQEDFEFVDPIRDLFDLRLWDQKILTRSVYEDEKSLFLLCPSLGKLSKRAAMCGNVAVSCERENSRIDRYKSKLSSSMGIDMMTARYRVARNGSPLHLFDADESVKYWILKGHRKGSKAVD